MSSPPESYMISPTLKAFTTPPAQFVAENPVIDYLIAGALVTNPAGKILLVRRAAHDSWPLLWEVPGGCVDPDDKSFVSAAVRELWEETGLRATNVLAAVKLAPDEAVESGEKEKDKEEEGAKMLGDVCIFKVKTVVWAKLTAWMDVADYNCVEIRPDEHQEWAWVSEEEARAERLRDGRVLEFTSDGVRRSVLDGFRLWKERKGQ
ncbi:Fc.00g002660.m01.CDS01 [Cosmosporella sp. VM-42]